jgi:hypothetical protein
LPELAASSGAGSIDARGEVVLVIGARGAWAGPGTREQPADGLAAARAEVERRVSAGAARGTAARDVSAETGIPRRQLYGVAAVARGGGLRPPPD